MKLIHEDKQKRTIKEKEEIARGEAPSEAANRLWWCSLKKVRTHFERNPD